MVLRSMQRLVISTQGHIDTQTRHQQGYLVLIEQYPLDDVMRITLELIDLPPLSRPMLPAAWMARAWQGRVAVW